MNIEIVTRKLQLTDAIARHATERFEYALNQYADRVGPVRVTLKDVNGPRGGEDAVCDVEITLPGLPSVHISKQAADVYAAVTAAADAAKHNVGKALDKAVARAQGRA